MKNKNWIRQSQEKGGDYLFGGKLYYTSGIAKVIPKKVILELCRDVVEFAKEQGGIDYIVVYEHQETGQKLLFIDQITDKEAESGTYQISEHYSTLLLETEY